MRHSAQGYGNVAWYLAISTVAQIFIHDLYIYNQAFQSPEAILWQEAMQEQYDALVANHKWNVVDTPANHRLLQEKMDVQAKNVNKGTFSWYKARLVAKSFERREKINYEGAFSFLVKSCSTLNIIRSSHILQLGYQASGCNNSLF